MQKLLDILLLNREEGDFGIEIEIEGRNLPKLADIKWKSVEDGSLRNGMEYVFKKPTPLKAVPLMLRRLVTLLKDAEAEVQFSFRTSVHVHMNMQDCTYPQILNTIYTYLLLEGPMMEFCGEARKGNRFCLRMEDAEGLMDHLKKLFKMGEVGLKRLSKDKIRYSAINVEALGKYGSLEFRAMEGNLDVDRITKWCTILSNIRSFACEMESPAAIYDMYIKMEADAFSKYVLKDTIGSVTYPDMIESIQRSFSLSLDLPFAYVESTQNPQPVEVLEQVIIKRPAKLAMPAFQWADRAFDIPPGLMPAPRPIEIVDLI